MAKPQPLVITRDELPVEPQAEESIRIEREDLIEGAALKITRDELPVEAQPEELIRIGKGDLIDGAALRITREEVETANDLRALFKPEHMRKFIAFISIGLPEVYLSYHKELLVQNIQTEIRSVIEKIPDWALKNHLSNRLEVLEKYQTDQSGSRN